MTVMNSTVSEVAERLRIEPETVTNVEAIVNPESGSRPITSKSANSFEARHPQGESRPWAAASRRYLL